MTILDNEAAFAEATRNSPVAVAGSTRIALQVEIDVAAERARLGKEIDRLEGEIAQRRAPSWATRASSPARPAAVVDQERKRVAEFTATMSRLQDQRARLESST